MQPTSMKNGGGGRKVTTCAKPHPPSHSTIDEVYTVQKKAFCHGKPASLSFTTVSFQFIILPAQFSDPFLVDTEAFVNASLFYMFATHVHVHELQTTNQLQQPVGACRHVNEVK